MPNWCSNRIVITGPEEEVERLIEVVKGEESSFDFHRILPRPEILELDRPSEKEKEAAIEQTGFSGWYHWSVHNWGTKWNACDPKFEVEVESAVQKLARAVTKEGPQAIVRYDFDTAWSPSSPVIAKLSEMFPAVKIQHSYIEEGCFFSGLNHYERGMCTEENLLQDDIYSLSDWHEGFRPEPEEDEE
jgi:hypothetical protein